MSLKTRLASMRSHHRRLLLAGLLLLVITTGSRAQAPEFGYWEQTPLPQQGLATYYNPGLMEYVRDYRLTAGDIDPCPECVGEVALLRAGDIGRKVWLKPPHGDSVGPFLVVDCARRQDLQPLLERNWVVDVSFEVGRYWGMDRPLDGVIVFEDPAEAAQGDETNRIPTPFAVAPGDVVVSPPTATPALDSSSLSVPTPWPTRMPVPLVDLVEMPAALIESTATPPPTPTAIWPPPLTPIITTPTPLVTPDAPFESVATATPQPTEVALARAGGELLLSVTNEPAEADVLTDGLATPTSRPTLARTPRVNLTPILPAPLPPAPTPTADAGPLDRLLRELLDLVR